MKTTLEDRLDELITGEIGIISSMRAGSACWEDKREDVLAVLKEVADQYGDAEYMPVSLVTELLLSMHMLHNLKWDLPEYMDFYTRAFEALGKVAGYRE